MRVYTAHLRDGHAPELVQEGFAWGALCFGPIWLAAHRAWIAAVIALALAVLVLALAPGAAKPVLLLALAVLQGMFGNDLRRFGLARRRFALVHVVAARDRDSGLARLLARRPDLGRALAQ